MESVDKLIIKIIISIFGKIKPNESLLSQPNIFTFDLIYNMCMFNFYDHSTCYYNRMRKLRFARLADS